MLESHLTLRGSLYLRDLISTFRAKKVAHVCFKRSNLFSDYIAFSELRSRCKSLSRCWDNYVRGSEQKISQNPKSFWAFLNNVKNVHSVSSCMYDSDGILREGSSVAECFVKFFKSVFGRRDGYLCDPSVLRHEHVTDISFIDLQIGDVYGCIESLSVHTTPN